MRVGHRQLAQPEHLDPILRETRAHELECAAKLHRLTIA